MTPYDSGVATRWHFSAGWFLLLVVWAATMGILIWLIVEFQRDRKYFCESAALFDSNDYIKFQQRAAEPYAGRPARVVSNVNSADTCQADCTNDPECRFFTHDISHSKCYMYHEGILPEQNLAAAVPGPTDLMADVYVKKFERVVELRGVLKDGK
jgi:hypothetical protein